MRAGVRGARTHAGTHRAPPGWSRWSAETTRPCALPTCRRSPVPESACDAGRRDLQDDYHEGIIVCIASMNKCPDARCASLPGGADDRRRPCPLLSTTSASQACRPRTSTESSTTTRRDSWALSTNCRKPLAPTAPPAAWRPPCWSSRRRVAKAMGQGGQPYPMIEQGELQGCHHGERIGKRHGPASSVDCVDVSGIMVYD